MAYRLLDRPEAATPEPPLTGKPRLECIRAPDASVPNPYSKLPEPARRHHARVTLAGGGIGRVELRDGLVFGGPRTFVFRGLTAPEAARLELGYRVIACGSSADASLEVEVLYGDAGQTLRYTHALQPPEASKGSRYGRWLRPLGVPPGQRFDLTLKFVGDLNPVSRIVITEPLITGGPSPKPSLVDRNVLLIIVDAMRGDAVGAGRRLPKPVAPTMEGWMNSKGGVGFSRAMSVSNQTRASTLALLQGQAPSHGQFHATSWQLNAKRKATYHESDPPLVTRKLAAAGHRVASIGHNRFLWNAAPIGLDHGYDTAIDVRAMTDDTRLITDHAIAYLQDHKDSRWFLTVNYVAPHNPYRPPEGYTERVAALSTKSERRPMTRSYLGEIAYVDDEIARLKKRLVAEGLAEDTLVIITADHGETFHGKHTCFSERFKMNCHFNHGLTLYDEEVHVPLAFILPMVFRRADVAPVVSHLSVAPTILDTLGLPADPRHTAPSLLDVLRGGTLKAPAVAYLETRAASGLRTTTHKLIVHHPRNDVVTPARSGGKSGRPPLEEIYDLSKDPWETENLVLKANAGTLTRALTERLATVRQRLSRPRPTDKPKTSRSTTKAPVRLSRDNIRVVGGATGVSFHVRLAPAQCPDEAERCKTINGGAEWTGDLAPGVTMDLIALAPLRRALSLSARFNGESVENGQVKFGPYGIIARPTSPTPKKGMTHGTLSLGEDALKLARGAHPPHVAGLSRPHLFYWRPDALVPGRYAGARNPESVNAGNDGDDDAMTEDMRRILKELGYSN